jgi:hypothetical protein
VRELIDVVSQNSIWVAQSEPSRIPRTRSDLKIRFPASSEIFNRRNARVMFFGWFVRPTTASSAPFQMVSYLT